MRNVIPVTPESKAPEGYAGVYAFFNCEFARFLRQEYLAHQWRNGEGCYDC